MEILNFKAINKGALAAKFDVKIAEWGMTIRECLFFEKEGRRWVNLPSRQYEAKDGTKKSFDYVLFEKEHKARFEASCLEKIKSGQLQHAPQKSSEEVPF